MIGQRHSYTVARLSRDQRAQLTAQVRTVTFDPLALHSDENAKAVQEKRQEAETEAANAERLSENRADAKLIAEAVAVARRKGVFDGRAWQQLSDKVCAYAWKTLQAKIARPSELAEMIAKYTTWYPLRYGDTETLRVDPDARMELATEILLRAVPDFQRNALLRGSWDPEGGARLTTYFMGTCAFHFRRAYEQWARERHEKMRETTTHYGLDPSWISPQFRAAICDVTGDQRLGPSLILLERQDETTKTIYQLIMRGLTYAEIAEQVGLSTSAIESRVRRFRQLVKRQGVTA